MQESPTEPEAVSTPSPARVFAGHYETERVLGRGQMGEVLLVRDRQTGARLALKRVPPELVRDASVFDGVRANFALVRGLDHPHIAAARALETDAATGAACLLLDYVPGVDLAAWLSRRRRQLGDPAAPLPAAETLGIAEQIASALDFAHARPAVGRARGILHRDLKPANVMVEDVREYRAGVPWVKLVDFGLAAEIQASLLSLSAHAPTHRAAGTPAYMAPEQWEGRTLTRGVDQWALSVMVYEMAAGRRPFHAHDVAVLREQVLRVTPEAPDGLAPSAWDALRRGLARDRRDRHPSCLALVHAIADADPATLGSIEVSPQPMPDEFDDSPPRSVAVASPPPQAAVAPTPRPAAVAPTPRASAAVLPAPVRPEVAPPQPMARRNDPRAPVVPAPSPLPRRMAAWIGFGLVLAVTGSGYWFRESARFRPPVNGGISQTDPTPVQRDPAAAVPEELLDPARPWIPRYALERLRAIPGVRAVHPVYNLIVEFDVARRHGAGELCALRPPGETGFLSEALVAGRAVADDAREVLITKAMAKDLGFEDPAMALGNTVRLTAVASRGREPWTLPDPYPFDIVGVFDTGSHEHGSSRLYVSTSDADRVRAVAFAALGEFGDVLDTFPGFSVWVTDPAALDPTKAAIEALGYRTLSMPDVPEQDGNGFLVVGALPGGPGGETGGGEPASDPTEGEDVVLPSGATTRIVEVLATEGARLAEGAILVRGERFPMAADPLAGQAAVDRATAERDRRAKERERVEQLAAQGQASADEVEAAHAAWVAANRELGMATMTLQMSEHMKSATDVKMPFAGVVVRVHVQAGELVAAEQPLVTVRRAGDGR